MRRNRPDIFIELFVLAPSALVDRTKSPSQMAAQPLTSRCAQVWEGGVLQCAWTPQSSSLTEKPDSFNPQAATGRGTMYYTLDTRTQEGRNFLKLMGIDSSGRARPMVPIFKYIMERRNAATKVAMQRAAAADDDPNAADHEIDNNVCGGGSDVLRNRRNALLDDIPNEMVIDIPAFGLAPAHMMRVLPTCWPGSRRRFRCLAGAVGRNMQGYVAQMHAFAQIGQHVSPRLHTQPPTAGRR